MSSDGVGVTVGDGVGDGVRDGVIVDVADGLGLPAAHAEEDRNITISNITLAPMKLRQRRQRAIMHALHLIRKVEAGAVLQVR